MTEYTTNIQKGGALLDDARLMVEAWDPALSTEENLHAVRDGDRLVKGTRSRAADVVLRVLRPRLVDPGAFVIEALRKVQSDPAAFADIVYFEAMRDDELLRDFATGPLYAHYTAGRSYVTVEDTLTWLASLAEPRVRAWSETVRMKVARGLLAALRDFGVLKGSVKKRFRAPAMTNRGFAYAAWRLSREAGTDRVVFTTELWRAWLLDPRRVEELVNQLDRCGVWSYSSAGSATRIDWRCDDIAEVLDAAA
ncbi:MAG TPA: BrxA family protein [Solirubrobacteraceae bacterium]